MQDVFTLVGLIASAVMALAVFLLCLAQYHDKRFHHRYHSLRRELNDACDVLAEVSDGRRALFSAGAVRMILVQLSSRNVSIDIKCILANDQRMREVEARDASARAEVAG